MKKLSTLALAAIATLVLPVAAAHATEPSKIFAVMPRTDHIEIVVPGATAARPSATAHYDFLEVELAAPLSVIPVIDSTPSWIDHRVMVTPFSAEKTLTKDTVPVDVDAVLFWVVWDAEKAALEVKDYQSAIAWAAQTALRDIIGRMMLADILVGRSAIDEELQRIIDERTTPWGVTVQSVELRDIVIPQDLEDAIILDTKRCKDEYNLADNFLFEV